MDKLSILKQIYWLCQQVINLQKKALTEKMVRQVCTIEELATDKIELVVAVIWAESGMDYEAINVNKNGTTDWGLCQFNDYFSKGQITPQEALYNPQKAVTLMAREVKAGHIYRWVAYLNGSYKKFLRQPK